MPLANTTTEYWQWNGVSLNMPFWLPETSLLGVAPGRMLLRCVARIMWWRTGLGSSGGLSSRTSGR